MTKNISKYLHTRGRLSPEHAQCNIGSVYIQPIQRTTLKWLFCVSMIDSESVIGGNAKTGSGGFFHIKQQLICRSKVELECGT